MHNNSKNYDNDIAIYREEPPIFNHFLTPVYTEHYFYSYSIIVHNYSSAVQCYNAVAIIELGKYTSELAKVLKFLWFRAKFFMWNFQNLERLAFSITVSQ